MNEPTKSGTGSDREHRLELRRHALELRKQRLAEREFEHKKDLAEREFAHKQTMDKREMDLKEFQARADASAVAAAEHRALFELCASTAWLSSTIAKSAHGSFLENMIETLTQVNSYRLVERAKEQS